MNVTGMASAYKTQRYFFAIAALLFAASATLTIALCDSMTAMDGMPMPGGWTLSMMWMPMSGQTWPAVAAQFVGMWLTMMIAMMLPSLLPMLMRYRQALGDRSGDSLDVFTALVAAGYFFAWTLFGVVAFMVGAMLGEIEMDVPQLARIVPPMIGFVVVIAGVSQFTRWKTHHLACCREASVCCASMAADSRTAWRHGLRLGIHCVHCCFGLSVCLLAVGMMNLYAMALITVAISLERVAPRGDRMAQCIGAVVVLSGLSMIANATVL